MTRISRLLALAALIAVPSPSFAQSSDWTPVLKLRAGEEFNVTIQGWTEPRTRMFVAADDRSVTFLNLAIPGASDAARRAIRNAALHHADDVAGVPAGRGIRIETLELRASGVYFAGRRIADLEFVVERVDVGRVMSIVRKSGPKGSEKGAAAGIGIGLGLGFLSFLNAANAEHVTNPKGNAFMGMGLIWMPIAGGVIGYNVSRQEIAGTVVYRR